MDHFEHDGLRFETRDHGPSAGEAVVCLHGFPQDASAFDDVVPPLVAAGLRVLTPDQRGYSPGARPTGRGAFTLRALVGDVVALLDAAGVDAAHIVGHDWGGAVAWAIAGRHRDRVRSLTVLSTPHPAAMQAAMVRSTQMLRSAYMAAFQVPWLPEAVSLAAGGRLMRAALTRSGLPAERAARYVRRMREPDALRSALGWYRALPLSAGYGPGRVRVPTTYVWGSRDPFFAPAAARRTGGFVTGPFRELRLDAGHWLPETRPLDVADAVLEAVAPDPT